MLAAALAPITYVGGLLGVAIVVTALAWGAWRMRGALLPDWTGAPARLAETVLALGVVIVLTELLGSVGWFRRGPVVAMWVAAGVAMGVTSRWIRSPNGSNVESAPAPRRAPREEVVVAALAAALVAGQWATHAAATLASGMTHPDTLWYHQPFAARFLQLGSFSGLDALGYSESRFFPFNSEMLHAIAIMPFERDVLSPLLNLGWAGLAVLAAWCIGRRRGVGALCVLGAVVVLGVPTIAGSQPGQASNDATAAALLLAAVALLLEGGLRTRPAALAAVAAGLALGTKLAVAVPVVVLTVGVVALALRQGRRAVAVGWPVALAASGGFWFIRNWVVADNPLPFFELHLGPLVLPERAEQSGPALLGHLTDLSVWRESYVPGLWDALGPGWPVVLAVGLGGAVLAVVRGPALPRICGAASLGGVFGYLLIPNTAGLSFRFNVRYLGPALLIGFTLLPLVLPTASKAWRRATWLVLLGLVGLNALARQYERIPAWPRGHLWPGLLLGAGVLIAVSLLVRAGDRTRTTYLALGGTLVGVLAIGGWFVQRDYLESRYVDAGLHSDRIFSGFRDVQDARIGVSGTVEVLPMFGLDLSNRVEQLEAIGEQDADPCRRWREVIAGRYRFVVLDRYGVVLSDGPPEEWFADDPAATEVIREGDGVVYRVDGPLEPAECA